MKLDINEIRVAAELEKQAVPWLSQRFPSLVTKPHKCFLSQKYKGRMKSKLAIAAMGRCSVSAQKMITEHCDELDDLVRRHDKDWRARRFRPMSD